MSIKKMLERIVYPIERYMQCRSGKWYVGIEKGAIICIWNNRPESCISIRFNPIENEWEIGSEQMLSMILVKELLEVINKALSK